MTFSPPTVTDRNCALRVPRIYMMQQLGKSPTSISTSGSDITGNLPTNLCVNTIATDPSTDGALLIGTQKGVYRGLPVEQQGGRDELVMVSLQSGNAAGERRNLEYQPVTQRLLAATFGRGVFMMPLSSRQGSESSLPARTQPLLHPS